MSTLAPTDDPRWQQLSAPFPAAAISRIPKTTCKACSDSQRRRCDAHSWVNRCSECGGNHTSAAIHLDYVGHADVTTRLDEVDPHWEWEPAYRDVDQTLLSAAIATGNAELVAAVLQAAPARYTDGGLWIRLTVLGVTRLGFGDAQGKSGPNAVKELIGDAIRNAAMRFGVATYLWSKSEAAVALKAEPEAQHEQGPQVEPPAEVEPQPQRRQARPPGRTTSQQQPPGPTDGQVATARALAYQAAKAATAASTTEQLEAAEAKAAKASLSMDVSAAITSAQRTAAAVHEPRLTAAGQVPLWAWLGACGLCITKGGTSVADASAYDEPDPAGQQQLATTP